MESDSAGSATPCGPNSSLQDNNEDFMTKIFGFNEDDASKVAGLSDASNKGIEPRYDPLTSFEQYGGISNSIFDKPNLTESIKALMENKKEADILQEKLRLSEKEKTDLQLKIDELQAQNYQFKYLKNLSDKIDVLKKDSSNATETYEKLKKEVNKQSRQLSEKKKTLKKLKKDEKLLSNMLKKYAQKLESTGLLTSEEKNAMKNYQEQNAVVDSASDSEGLA